MRRGEKEKEGGDQTTEEPGGAAGRDAATRHFGSGDHALHAVLLFAVSGTAGGVPSGPPDKGCVESLAAGLGFTPSPSFHSRSFSAARKRRPCGNSSVVWNTTRRLTERKCAREGTRLVFGAVYSYASFWCCMYNQSSRLSRLAFSSSGPKFAVRGDSEAVKRRDDIRQRRARAFPFPTRWA